MRPDKKRDTWYKCQLFTCALLILYFFVGAGAAQRAIPDDNLAYPVLITLGDGSSGSGFFLNNGKAIYLVTARHVLFKNKLPQQITPQQPDPLELRSGTGTLVSYSKDPADPTQNMFTLDFLTLEASGNIKRHPTQDVVVVKLADLGIGQTIQSGKSTTVPGVTIKQMAKDGVLDVGTDNVKTFDQTLTGNDIMVFGYPGSIGLQNLPAPN